MTSTSRAALSQMLSHSLRRQFIPFLRGKKAAVLEIRLGLFFAESFVNGIAAVSRG